MRVTILFLFIALLTTSVDAVTYQKLDGSIITLKKTSGENHPYSGDNLEPYATILGDYEVNTPHLNLYYADLRDADLRNVTGTGVVLGAADLTGANLSNASLPQLYGQSMTFVNTNFTDADLSGAWMNVTDFTNANFTNANLSSAVFNAMTTVTGADFTNANLSGARFPLSMTYAQMLSAASLHGAYFWNSDWSNRDFSNLDLTEGVFAATNLYGANFSGAILRDADLKAMFGNTSFYDDATNSNFSGADLDGAQIEYRDFTGANFQNAQLTNITASVGSRFVNVDFRNANLSNSVFIYMDGPYTHSTVASGADLSGANLTNATIALNPINGWGLNDFSGANISGVTFAEFDYPTWDTGNTWTSAFYYTDNEPIWGTGLDAAWRSSVGILALAPVPEPAAILLALFGLALLPRRRRR